MPIVCPADVVADGLVDDVVDHVEVSVASFAPLARRALVAALFVVGATGLRSGRLFRSVRDVIVIAYFDQPTVKERLGYRPAAWTTTTAARWHQEWGAEAERHRELLRTRLPRPGERA